MPKKVNSSVALFTSRQKSMVCATSPQNSFSVLRKGLAGGAGLRAVRAASASGAIGSVAGFLSDRSARRRRSG